MNAQVRGQNEGKSAIPRSRFTDWGNIVEHRRFANDVLEETCGIPIGVILSA